MTLNNCAYILIFLSFIYALLHAFYDVVQATETYVVEVEGDELYTREAEIKSDILRLKTSDLMNLVKEAHFSCVDENKNSCTQLSDF